MKTKADTAGNHAWQALRLPVLAACALLAASASAQVTTTSTTFETSTTISFDRMNMNTASTAQEYFADNGALVVFMGSAPTTAGAGAAFNLAATETSLTIAPSSPGGTGWIRFTNFAANGNAGVINASTDETLRTTLTNVIFDNNTASSNGGVIRNVGTLIVTNGTFLSNAAGAGSSGGAIQMAGASASATFNNVTFESNWAGSNGGAIQFNPGTLDMTNVLFASNTAGNFGGALQLNNASVSVTATNVTFRDNASTNNGGAIHVNPGTIKLFGALFSGNHSNSNGGAIQNNNNGVLTLVGGTFASNYATAAGGALHNTGANASASLTDAAFLGNRSNAVGGAVAIANSAITLVDVDFKNNWASGTGGAISDISNAAGSTLRLTGSNGVTDYFYTGNFAGGGAAGSASADALATGAADFAASAAAGGFYYQNYSAAGAIMTFDIASGVTLTIGDAATANRAHDSIASASANARIAKTGSGEMVLNADNSHYSGTFAVNEGKLLLGNTEAVLGGVINVASGATFGGSGMLATAGGGASKLNANAGSFIEVGASSTAPGTLTVNDLSFTDATLVFDLFGWDGSNYISDQLLVLGTLDPASTGTIAVGAFMSGTYNLGNLGALEPGLTAIVQGGGTRQSASIQDDGGSLILIANADPSCVLTWTGLAGLTLGATPGSYTDGALINEFATGDKIVFDTSAAAANRSITIAPAGVSASEIIVGEDGYTFSGEGGITTGTRFIQPAATPAATLVADGKLHKTGPGTLTFANTGANNFEGGIRITGGILAFNNAAQLGTLDNASVDRGITFAGNGTLRANAGIANLANNITIDNGVAAAIDTNGNAVTYTGALALAATSGTLAKLGAGTLALTTDNSAFAGATQVSDGTLLLSGPVAKLGGAISVAPAAMLAGDGTATGSVTLASSAALIAGDTHNDSVVTAPATFAIGGALNLANNAILKYDLYSGNQSDLITVDSLALAGNGIIDISSLGSGTYTLITSAASLSTRDLDSFSTTQNGGGLGNRTSDSYSLSADSMSLLLTLQTANLSITWSGSNGSNWASLTDNWSGGDQQFVSADKVTFGDTGAGTVAVDGAGVLVSDMLVNSAASYIFTNGAITTTTNATGIGAVTGKLQKSDIGTLTFANASNNFIGGIEISGGVIAFNDAAQLGTLDNGGVDQGITFTDTSTLRANAAIANLANNIIIADGKTAALDTNGNAVTYTGTLSLAPAAASGTFAKAGAGTLTLSSDFAVGSSGIAADIIEGALMLDSVTLGGATQVRSGATLGGSGAVNAASFNASSTLQIQDSLAIASLAIQGDTTLAGSGTLTLAGGIASGATATVAVGAGSQLDFEGSGFTGGTGAIEKTGGGVLALASSAVIDVGSIAVNEGAFKIGDGASVSAASSFGLSQGSVTLESGASLSAHAIALNGGVFQMRDATASAASGFAIGSGAELRATGVTNTINAASFTNAGVIRIGRSADALSPYGTLAITGGSYTGNDGAVYITADLDGDAVVYDQLALRDLVISGTTALFVNALSPMTTEQLMLIEPLDLAGATIASDTVFAMSESDGIATRNSVYNWAYSLPDGWYPVAYVSPLKAMLGMDAVSLLMGTAALDSAGSHITALRGIQHEPKARVWFNSLYRQDKLSSILYDGASARTSGAQVGVDWGKSGSAPNESLAAGVFYDYVSASLEIPGRASSVDSRASGVGVYFAWEQGRLYASGIFHRTFDMKHEVSAPATGTADTKGRARAVSIETGYKIFDGKTWKTEIYAQYANQNHSIYSCVDTDERLYQFKRVTSSLWRGGARIWRDFTLRSGSIVRPWVRASYAHEQDAASEMTVLTLANNLEWKFANDMGGSGAIAEAGVSLELGRRFLLTAGGSWYSVGKVRSHSFNFGANIAW